MINWLFVLVLIGSIAFCAIKIIPVYIDNQYVKDGLISLGEEFDPSSLSVRDMKKRLDMHFSVNNVQGLTSKDAKFFKKDGGIEVTLDYDSRIHMFKNLYVVVEFRNYWHSNNPNECCERPVE